MKSFLHKKTENPIEQRVFRFLYLVQMAGLEPARALCPHEPESCAYANSATSANAAFGMPIYCKQHFKKCQDFS